MTYQAALNYVASLEPRGWRLGLDRMEAFCQRLGLEQDLDGTHRRYFHVAGTNGKGSTTAFIQYLLHGQGLNCGAFFSPFVVDPRERIQLGLNLIGKPEYGNLVESLRPIAESMSETEFGGITEFEFKTAMGFQAWKNANCEAVALETGLGGRLDATNVVVPASSAIVSIGLDHQAILGNTLAEIAGEKAGIIKEGRPAVIGNLPPEAFERIERVAKEKESPLYVYGMHFSINERGTFQSIWGEFRNAIPARLVGKWQVHNFAIAMAALLAASEPLTASAVQFAAKNAFLPGRFQKLQIGQITLILDGAHNLDSAKALVETFQNDSEFDGKKAVLISNMVQGHDPQKFYEILAPIIQRVLVPPIDFHRSRLPEEVVEITSQLQLKSESFASLETCLKEAISLASRVDSPILVAGSFYLVGEVVRVVASLKD